MAFNKKFRIQNGVDITGEVVVGGQLVINADGTLVAAVTGEAVSSSEIDGLQSQIDAILGSSPEQLDTLQEIVAAFSSADGDLQTLISNTSAAVTALQTAISRQLNPFDQAVLSLTKINGGSAFNVIPDNVSIGGTLRSTNKKTRDEMLTKIKKIASNACDINNCKVNLQSTKHGLS